MHRGRADDLDVKIKKLRLELEESERRNFDANKRLTSYEEANENMSRQNKEFENK